MLVFAPLLLLVFVVGVYPQPILDDIGPASDRLLRSVNRSIEPPAGTLKPEIFFRSGARSVALPSNKGAEGSGNKKEKDQQII
jgi:hypothetical protein